MTIPILRLVRVAATAAALAVLLAACGGDGDAATSTTIGGDDVVFGSGSMPDTIPDDFPVPEEAVISSTLVVRSTGITEVIMRIPVEVAAAVAYFDENLPARGFELPVSEAQSGEGWLMEVERDDLAGTIDFKPAPPNITEIVMRFAT